MKRRWIAVGIFGGGALALLGIGALLQWILGLFGLTLRPWVVSLGLWVPPLLLIVAVMLLLSIVVSKTAQRISGVKAALVYVLCFGISGAIVWGLGVYALLGFVFSQTPEHVVQRDERAMVAVVESFLDVYVYYYGYQNAFIMGKEPLLCEYYGSGGYDPFEREDAPAPQEITDERE